MKVAWLTSYPLSELIARGVDIARTTADHPVSWIVTLAEALRAEGSVELHIVTASQCVSRSQHVEHRGIHVHVLRDAVPFTHRGFPPWCPWDAATGFGRCVSRLRRIVAEISPDVVHAHGTEGPYALAACGAGRPTVISMQGIVTRLRAIRPSLRFFFTARHEQYAVQHARHFMCRTHFDRTFVRGLNPTARIFHVDEAISPVFFEPAWSPPPGKRILFVGSGLKWKGLDLLLDALETLHAHDPEIHLDVAGRIDAAGRRACRRAMRNARIPENAVTFHGFLPAQEIAVLQRRCSVFVLPSRNDNSPNALAEALVSGMPAVAFDVGGVSSMFRDGVSGRLIRPGDVGALANAIECLLSDRERSAQMGRAARREGQRHRPERVAFVVRDVYNTLT